MDVFVLAMKMDEEGAYQWFCSSCGYAGWGHDRYYDPIMCQCGAHILWL